MLKNNNNILLHFSGNGWMTKKGGYALIDKATATPILFDKIAFDDNFIWEPYQIFALSDRWMIIPIPADLLLAAEHSEILKQFPNLNEEDNPILCIAKIK